MAASTPQKLPGKLLEVQRELKVAKSQLNTYGGYSYRSKEDILEAAKPLCHERGVLILCDDAVVQVADWVYVKSVAAVCDVETGERIQMSGWAREPESRKGMDASQITGTAASYAGKRALGNLFALDDAADADAPAPEAAPAVPEAGPFTAHCRSCGTRYTFADAAQYEAYVAGATCCPAPSWEVE